MASRTFRKKKQHQSRVFLGVIFYVYTNVDNRERARAKQRERISWGEKHSGGKKMRNAPASKVKMSGGEK